MNDSLEVSLGRTIVSSLCPLSLDLHLGSFPPGYSHLPCKLTQQEKAMSLTSSQKVRFLI